MSRNGNIVARRGTNSTALDAAQRPWIVESRSSGKLDDARKHAPDPSRLELPSARSRELLAELRRTARHDTVTVCIVGPSGTGKSLYAEEVHRRSPRHEGPFVELNMGAIDSGLAVSELIGHAAGAFTGARGARDGALFSATGGTLVLDEITKASLQVQHILLRILDRKSIRSAGSDRDVLADVRLIALTSETLEEAVCRRALIPDLYERLKAFVHVIAPLSERRIDVPVVLQAALRHHAADFGYSELPELDSEMVAEVQQWPLTGNHRELDGLVQRLLVNAEGGPVLHRGHLPRGMTNGVTVARSNHERWVHDLERGLRPVFQTVADEAKYYHASAQTIHRWRKERAQSTPGLSCDSHRVSRECHESDAVIRAEHPSLDELLT